MYTFTTVQEGEIKRSDTPQGNRGAYICNVDHFEYMLVSISISFSLHCFANILQRVKLPQTLYIAYSII